MRFLRGDLLKVTAVMDGCKGLLTRLDVTNLPESWIKWRRKFQVYFSANFDHINLTDRRKLAIFLNNLGSKGMALAFELIPELDDFDSPAAREITFDHVWTVMNDHCVGEKKDHNSFLASYKFYKFAKDCVTRDISCAYADLLSAAEKYDLHEKRTTDEIIRDQLMQVIMADEIIPELLELKNPTTQELITKIQEIELDQHIWSLILPYLSLCDLQNVAQISSRFEKDVHRHIKVHGAILIGGCCLEKYPVEANADFYQTFAADVHTLQMNGVAESDVRKIGGYFNKIQKFTMTNMTILDDIEGLPRNLSDLTLVNCNIDSLQSWYSSLKTTLVRLYMENVPWDYIDDVGNHFHRIILNFNKLASFIIKGDTNYGIVFIQNTLEYLSLTVRRMINPYRGYDNLKALYLNTSYVQYFGLDFWRNLSQLESLTIKIWMFGDEIQNLKSLRSLEIIYPVDPIYKEAIESLNIPKVKVEYLPYPQEPNLMTDMLNDDCLLEIISYLDPRSWMKFGQLHWKIEGLVAEYKYGREEVDIDDLQRVVPLDSDHFDYIRQFITKYFVSKLGFVAELPGGFSNLKSLRYADLYNFHGLLPVPLNHLRNMRQIIIGFPISMDQLTLMLERNANTLECLHIILESDDNSVLKSFEDNFNLIASMDNLKEIYINNYYSPQVNGLLEDLYKKIGHQITKFTIHVRDRDHLTVLRSENFVNLRELTLHFQPHLREEIVKAVSMLKSLTRLKITKTFHDPWFEFYINDLLVLIDSLPRLTVMQVCFNGLSIRAGLLLEAYLKMKNRRLKIT